MSVCLHAFAAGEGASQLQFVESDITVVCRYIGMHLCQAILVPLYRAFRYSGYRYIGSPTVTNQSVST